MHGSSRLTLTSASSCTKSLWGTTAAAIGWAALLVDDPPNVHHVLCHFATSPSSGGQAAAVDDPGVGTVDMPGDPPQRRRPSGFVQSATSISATLGRRMAVTVFCCTTHTISHLTSYLYCIHLFMSYIYCLSLCLLISYFITT